MKKIILFSFLAAVFSFGISGLLINQLAKDDIGSFVSRVVQDRFKEAKTNWATEVVEAKDINELIVNTEKLDVTIKSSSDDKIHVKYLKQENSKNTEKVYSIFNNQIIFSENQELSENKNVKVNINFSQFDIQVNESAFTIEIPAQIKTVKIKTVSGQVHVDLAQSNQVEKFDIQTTSGDVKLESFIKLLEVTTVSGDLNITTASEVIEASLKTISGDTKVKFNDKPNLKLNYKTTSGEIVTTDQAENHRIEGNYKMALGSGAGNLSIETISGDARVDF